MKLLKRIAVSVLVTLGLVAIPFSVYAVVLQGYQGGTGISTTTTSTVEQNLYLATTTYEELS